MGFGKYEYGAGPENNPPDRKYSEQDYDQSYNDIQATGYIGVFVAIIAFLVQIGPPLVRFLWSALGLTGSIVVGGLFVLASSLLLFLFRESNRKLYAALEIAIALYIGGITASQSYHIIQNHATQLPTTNVEVTGKLIAAFYFAIRGFDNWTKSAEEWSKFTGYTKLMLAVYRGWNWLIVYYLKRGHEHIDQTNFFGTTALMIAVKQNREKTVKLLLDKGANVQIQNQAGEDALTIARKNENAVIYKTLLDHEANNSSHGSSECINP